MDDNLDIDEVRRRLWDLVGWPSRSAEEARARQLAEIRAIPVEDRIRLALRLDLRDVIGRSRTGRRTPRASVDGLARPATSGRLTSELDGNDLERRIETLEVTGIRRHHGAAAT